MLQNILNLSGVEPLDITQQRMINGGQVCGITLWWGGEEQMSFVFEDAPEGEDGSHAMHQTCLSLILDSSLGADRCTYDCEFDGFGQ